MRIRWEQVDGNWLPIVINVQADFFDIESPDLRIPFMQTFGREFDFTMDSSPILGKPWGRPEGMDPEDMDIVDKPQKLT